MWNRGSCICRFGPFRIRSRRPRPLSKGSGPAPSFRCRVGTVVGPRRFFYPNPSESGKSLLIFDHVRTRPHPWLPGGYIFYLLVRTPIPLFWSLISNYWREKWTPTWYVPRLEGQRSGLQIDPPLRTKVNTRPRSSRLLVYGCHWLVDLTSPPRVGCEQQSRINNYHGVRESS